jgi:1-phosphofructokinase family hexose kinase
MTLKDLALDQVQRAENAFTRAGGKGVNVARSLCAVGESSTLIGFTGGATGELIKAGIAREGLTVSPITIKGDSRECVILTDRSAGTQTVINEDGPQIAESEVGELIHFFRIHIQSVESVILTGSLPPGVDRGIYKQLAEIALSDKGRRILLDAVGEPLLMAIADSYFVKINLDEARSTLNRKLADSLEAAEALFALGARNALVSDGGRSAAVAGESGSYRLTPPVVDNRNAVGSGDAALAGLALGLSRGLSVIESSRLALAFGTANARFGLGNFSHSHILELQDQIGISVVG